MFDIKHKSKWHRIKDVEKSEDGSISYVTDGIHGKVHSKDIEDVRLAKEYELKNPDGTITRGPGKEPLMKPMKKGALKDRWSLLKAKLNHETAIQSLTDDDEEGDEGDGKQASDGAKPVPAEPAEGGGAQDGRGEADDSEGDAGTEPLSGGDDSAEAGMSDDDSDDDEALAQDLKERGYSDAEIAHIVSGHVPQQLTPEEMEAQGHSQALEHKDMSHQQKLEAEGAQHKIKQSHAERMADLEAEYAKKEKELKLKYLEQELQTKIANLKSKGKE